MPKPNKKLEIISLLRVLAALGVAWFHFTNGNVSFLDAGWLKNSGKYGWLGVEVFFVISGFVVPYSLFS
jgi:peptidoglycan/LPS O-acetylase OafA/YrhL